MDVNLINAYLQRARKIIGNRSQSEIAYDTAVVAYLNRGMDIRKAIDAANREHPKEALKPAPNQWVDVAIRYEYLTEHAAILKKLGIKE